MSEVAILLLAAATALGAWCAVPVPLLAGLIPVAVGASMRIPWVMTLGVLVLASGLAARAWSGLDAPPTGVLAGEVTLVTDPELVGEELSAEVTFEGRHYQAELRQSTVEGALSLLAGERLTVTGRIEPLGAGAGWLAHRHVVGRLVVDRVVGTREAGLIPRAANRFRRLLARGWSGLPQNERALLAGMVLGDDREQTPLVADDFRAAGLSHLLAVSGQNVAFVLAVISPLSRGMGRWGRLVLSLLVLVFFALMTRFEPSVLRATAMAALATVGVARGRPLSGWRPLGLGVTLLLLIDPLLVHSVGFRLSVAASAGILALARPIAARLPGPEPLAGAVGVAVAAQAGVAPIAASTFGGLPLLAVPANLLAAPAVGPVMVWGMTGGVLAGVAEPVLATLLHQPTRLFLAWILAVARWAAGSPSVELGPVHLLSIALWLALGQVWARRHWRAPAVAAICGALAVLAAAALRGPAPLAFGEEVVPGVRVWRDGSVTVLAVEGGFPVGRTLRSLRESDVRSVDLIVVESAGAEAEQLAVALVERLEPALLWGPRKLELPGLEHPRAGSEIRWGDLLVRVRPSGGGLQVSVTRSDGPRVASDRAPPPGASPIRSDVAGAGDGHPEPHP